MGYRVWPEVSEQPRQYRFLPEVLVQRLLQLLDVIRQLLELGLLFRRNGAGQSDRGGIRVRAT